MEDLTSVFRMYVRPIFEYASPLWHSSLTKQQSDQLELIQKRACRIILGTVYGSYAEALEQLELCSLVKRREDLLRGFGQSIQKSERHRAMLPASRHARHGRNLRNANKLDAPKCRTTRYRKSTIPAVVDRLNSEFFIVYNPFFAFSCCFVLLFVVLNVCYAYLIFL